MYGERYVQLSAFDVVQVRVPLPRATAEFGRFLAVKSLRVCYEVSDSDAFINATALVTNEIGGNGETVLIVDNTDRMSTSPECYDVTLGTPQAVAGMAYLFFELSNGAGSARTVAFYSFALTVTPLAAGAAEVPGGGGLAGR